MPTPAENVFFLPNQLPLFLLDRLGWLLIVAGEPGLSDFRLSDDDSVRRPKNFRTDPGRLVEGLVGDIELAASLVRAFWCCPSATESSDALPWAAPFCGGKPDDFGVGCDDSGPCPGVGGRGVWGGLSSGAGMVVPSVREKLIGVSVSGFHSNLPTGMMDGVEKSLLRLADGCELRWLWSNCSWRTLTEDERVLRKPQAGGSSGGASTRRRVLTG